ncbi:MAG: CHAT domain-containing protein [Acidobacteriota bacterium]
MDGFQLRWLEYEKAPRSAVHLEIERKKERRQVSLPAGTWGLTARPPLPEDILDDYLLAKDQAEVLEHLSASDRYRDLADRVRMDDPRAAIFLLERSGKSALKARRWERGQRTLMEAVTLAEAIQRPEWAAILRMARGTGFRQEGNTEEAERLYADSADDFASLEDYPLLASEAVKRRAELYLLSGELDKAESMLWEGLPTLRREADEGLLVGRSLGMLGSIEAMRGDFEKAEGLIRNALEIEQRHDPGSITEGAFLSNLGWVASAKGNLLEAETFLMGNLEILQRRGGSATRRAKVWNNLALVRWKLGDLVGAEDLLRQAIALKDATQGETPSLAASLNSLAEVQRMTGDLAAAEATAHRALAIKKRVSHDTYSHAFSLGTLGNIASDRGQPEAAHDLFQQALEILRRELSGSMGLALALGNAADLAYRRGDLQGAETWAKEALAIEDVLAPESEQRARTLRLLGKIARRAGSRDQASRWYSQSLDVLDGLALRTGSSDMRLALFWREAADTYREAIDLFAESGETERAFGAVERSRARSLLRQLAARGVDQDPALRDEMRRVGRRYERLQRKLTSLSLSDDSDDLDRLRNDLRQIRRAQEQLWEEAAKGRRFPELTPLGSDEVSRSLDSGTMLLAFSVTKKRTWLFTLDSAGTLEAHALDVGSSDLRSQVEAFRRAIREGRRPNGAGDPAEVSAHDAGRRLYSLLLASVEDRTLAADRLAILPDGVLYDLPFAALVTSSPSGAVQYLIERWPVHMAQSGTLLSALSGGAAPGTGNDRLVAFGDPAYDEGAESAGNDGLRGVRATFGRLLPLPGSRREVTAISKLFSDSRTFLGAEATEEAVRQQVGEADYLHLACHGLADPQSPLDSALALSLRGAGLNNQENGILQAWEILQDLRLDAELVVLSACSTVGAGAPMGGEGLQGLTRAFQAAGARTVVAPLWDVSDHLTADLMVHFYSGLRRGEPKDEALRQAQLAILASGEDGDTGRSPYFWAAFQLYGSR